MAEVNQALAVNNVKLSNLDPDMEITLEDHSVVKISNISADTITYEFSGTVDTETTYNLNLTFIYKKAYRVVVPMTFVHNVISEDSFVVTPTVAELKSTTDHDFPVEFDAMLNGVGNADSISLDLDKSTLSAGLTLVSQDKVSDTRYRVTLNTPTPISGDNIFLFVRDGHSADGVENKDFTKATIRLVVENGVSSATWDPDFKVSAAEANYIPIKIVDKDGNPLEGVTIVSLSVVSDPRNGVINGWSNTLLPGEDGEPGSYQIRVTMDHLPGTITVKMVLSYNGTEFVVPDEVFTVPGGEFTVVTDPATVDQDVATDVTLTVTQKTYSDPNHKFTGRITSIETTEDSMGINTQTPIIITDGQAVINVTGKNTLPSTIAGVVQEYDSNMDVWREAGNLDFLLSVSNDLRFDEVHWGANPIDPATDGYYYFALVDQNDADYAGATVTDFSVTSSVPYGLVDDEYELENVSPGNYRIKFKRSEWATDISITIKVKDRGRETEFTSPVISSPASEITIAYDPASLTVNQATDVVITATCNKYGAPNSPLAPLGLIIEPTFTNLTWNVQGTYINLDENGSATINVTGDSIGTATFSGRGAQGNFGGQPRPLNAFSQDINVAAVMVGPTVESGTTDMSLNLWDKQPINYKVMAGDTDVTSSVTKITDQSDPNEHIDFVKVDDTYWGYQAVKAEADQDVTIEAMVAVHVTYEGTEYVLPMTIDVVVKANTTNIPVNRFDVNFV